MNRVYITRTPYPGQCQALGSKDSAGNVTVNRFGADPQPWNDYQAEHPQHRALSWEELYPEIKAHETAMTTEPAEISEAEYREMLEVLPPGRYHRVKGWTVFHCIEMLTGNICSWYAEKAGKWYAWTDFQQITDAEIVAKLERVTT